MYEDNNVRINIDWKNLILKLVLVVLVILLIIWIFPMPKLDVFYNKVYNENMTTMKDAAEKYFTSNKLPEQTGNSVTLKLQDMLDKKLITSFVDKNNKECSNTNSFAQVTKTEDDNYVLKVQLSCDDKTDYILENINTTSIIANASEAKNTKSNNNDSSKENDDDSEDDGIEIDEKILKEADSKYDKGYSNVEYQYKRAITKTSTTYACPSGYVKDNNVCYKYNTEDIIAATPLYFSDTKVENDAKVNTTGGYTQRTTYNKTVNTNEKVCPEGYTLNGNICYKYVSATIVPGTTTYSCPSGYTLNGRKCVQTISVNKNTTPGSTYYTCDKGGSLSGSTCKYSASKTNGNTTCKCPSGYSESNGSCVKTITYAATYHPGSTTYGNCPSGYSASGSQCVKTYAAKATVTWSNPKVVTSSTPLSVYSNATSKRVLVNKQCTLKGCTYTYYEYSASTSYSCPNGGTRSGTTCKITTNRPVSTSQGYYTCNGTKTNSSTCTKKEYASKKCTSTSGEYYCPNGGSLSGSTCTYNATKHTSSGSSYSTCPSGYYLSGSSCIKEIDATENISTTTYTCPVGYVREGTTCYQYTEPTNKVTYNYTCPEGYTQSGTGENTTCTKTVESKSNYYCENSDEELVGNKCIKTVKGGIKGYSCPDGYLLNKDKCVKKTIDCTTPEEITNTSVTYEYKWSSDPSLEGWTQTGKTRSSGSTNESNKYEK